MATITVRLIRSFEYRTIKSIVLHDVDLDQSIEDFVKHLAETIRTYPGNKIAPKRLPALKTPRHQASFPPFALTPTIASKSTPNPTA